jgi:hypothetical protein
MWLVGVQHRLRIRNPNKMKPSFQEIELARLSERAGLSLIKTAQGELCGKQSSIGEGKMKPSTGETMKLSVEAKVAAALAAAFIALTLGAIAQGNSASPTGGPNSYGPTNNPEANAHMSQEGYDSSLPGRTNTNQPGD